MPVFDETIKLLSEKKMVGTEFLGEAIKRSQVGTKGVHFINQQELQARNASIDQRFDNLKKETKVKLKDLSNLISEIDYLSFD